ncbi:sensor histidine kinase [Frankia sp. AgB32]|uniref:sensor histidine kinase n=1 Tax=Frankia sp. AgB32 TaxID=631119 RepID=UPI00200C3C12|nr:sensor histidine kinase [Frankia sp. AgB32]MCK9895591.1 sensor domain-containing protein [Frankia sp. AgB32]
MSVIAAASPDRAVAGSPGADGPPAPTRPPRRAADAATWRGLLYLLLNFPLTLLGFLYVTIMLSLGLGLVATVVGIPLLALGFQVCRWFGDLDRARAGRLLGLHIPKPSRPPRRRGFGLDALADPVAWRHALYLLIRLPWGIVCLVAVLLLVIVGWVVLPWATRGLVAVDKAMARGLLSPSAEVEQRIRELAVQQAAQADSAAHLRRIERNLHDGAQARLVALAMGLGMAKEKLAEDPQAAALMVAEAHGEAKLALLDLRDLARGINPAILTDRGLPAALASLADRCTVPTRATVELPHRPAAALEGIIYFTASELLTNISKHSQATSASLDLRVTGDASLLLEISDDGVGGADPRGGTGLAGLTGRIGAINGVMTVDSPPGGPTVVRVELPRPEGPSTRN